MDESSRKESLIPRRRFLTTGMSAFTGILAVSHGLGVLPAHARKNQAKAVINSSDLSDLLVGKSGFKGSVFRKDDSDFRVAAVENLWNKLQPERRPDLIFRVKDDTDVISAVNFAREKGLKIAVLGGGHNWCNPSLRNNGIMLDLSDLKGIVSIDEKNRKAVVNPIVSNREIQAALNPLGLAFPSGHCPQVKVSGYFLSGGMSWNQGTWGPGVGSVEAIELVTAEGKLITASPNENQDYFWAARGGGCGFFGVALRYHLKLYELPTAITCSVYYYPYDELLEIAKWLEGIAPELPASVELSLFIVDAPSSLSEKISTDSKKVAMVTATMFANDLAEAKQTLESLETCPLIDKCLEKVKAQPSTFNELFDASGALWPENLRAKVDAVFSDAPLNELMSVVKDHLPVAPSKQTVFMFAIFTGKNVPQPTPADAAFSMSAKYYGGPWTMWSSSADDEKNFAWHNKCVQMLIPKLKGHYVSETDTVGHPEYAKKSFSQKNWNKLAALRKKYDPRGLFFDFTGGLG